MRNQSLNCGLCTVVNMEVSNCMQSTQYMQCIMYTYAGSVLPHDIRRFNDGRNCG